MSKIKKLLEEQLKKEKQQPKLGGVGVMFTPRTPPDIIPVNLQGQPVQEKLPPIVQTLLTIGFCDFNVFYHTRAYPAMPHIMMHGMEYRESQDPNGEDNSAVLWFRSVEDVDTMIEHLQNMKKEMTSTPATTEQVLTSDTTM